MDDKRQMVPHLISAAGAAAIAVLDMSSTSSDSSCSDTDTSIGTDSDTNSYNLASDDHQKQTVRRKLPKTRHYFELIKLMDDYEFTTHFRLTRGRCH